MPIKSRRDQKERFRFSAAHLHAIRIRQEPNQGLIFQFQWRFHPDVLLSQCKQTEFGTMTESKQSHVAFDRCVLPKTIKVVLALPIHPL